MSDLDQLETRAPDQIPLNVTADPLLGVLVQLPDGTIQRLAWDALLGKLLKADLVLPDSATLLADLAHDEHSVGFVYADPDASKSGWYRKTGASGAGNWTQFEKLSSQALAEVQAVIQQAIDARDAALLAAADARSQGDVAALQAGRQFMIDRARAYRRQRPRANMILGDGQSNIAEERAYAVGERQLDYKPPLAVQVNGGANRTYLQGIVNTSTNIADSRNYVSLQPFTARAGFGAKSHGWAINASIYTVIFLCSLGAQGYDALQQGGAINADGKVWMDRAAQLLWNQGYYGWLRRVEAQGEADTDTMATGGAAGTAVPFDVATTEASRREWHADRQADGEAALADPEFVLQSFVHLMLSNANENYRTLTRGLKQSIQRVPGLNAAPVPYGYPGEADIVHSSARGQVLTGEGADLWADLREEGKKLLNPFMLFFVRVPGTDNQIDVHHFCASGALQFAVTDDVLDADLFNDFRSGAGNAALGGRKGYQYEHDGTLYALTSATVMGKVVRLVAAAPLPAQLDVGLERVLYASQTPQPGLGNALTNKPRGNACGQLIIPSRFDPGFAHRDWVEPGYCYRAA